MAGHCLLYYITDRTQFPGDEHTRRRALLDKITEGARAEVDYIQLREKDLSARELEKLASECVEVMQRLRTENRELGTRLLINSRTDVALAVGADGIHLRSDDISVSYVREIWREAIARDSRRETRGPLVGVSCHTCAEVTRAESEGANFAVFAPVFEKRDAHDLKPQGLSALREASVAKIPVLALGGVTLESAASCLGAGAAGIAGIRLFQENKIEDIVRGLRAL